MRNLRVAIESDDQPEIVAILTSLQLSEPELWMTNVFGEPLGKELAKGYQPQREDIGKLAQLLKTQFADELTEISIERFQTAETSTATGYQSEALKKMKTPVGLYSVRFRSKDGKRNYHLWSFVHDKESFRYIGKLREAGAEQIVGERDLSEYRIEDVKRISANEK